VAVVEVEKISALEQVAAVAREVLELQHLLL
jgi:hypothetical protein